LPFSLVAAFASAAAILALAPQYSDLWGRDGERWSPAGRLPDFSYAGYHSGEAKIPEVPLTGGVNVRDFGARGDGEQDDTDAILKAVAAVQRGVVYLPAGRYKLTGIVEIRKSGVVLRGAGAGKTILYCPKPLHEIRPDWSATTSGQKTSNYSWAGGFLWVRGSTGRRALATVAEAARRGATRITLSTTDGLKPGQWIEIAQRDEPSNSLAAHLYSDDPGDTAKLLGRTRASLVTRISAVEGKTVAIERALRFDLEARWRPTVLSFEPSVTEVGIEHLGFEFPADEYKGHFTEFGYNPIAFTAAVNCWARDIHIANPDSGLFIGGWFNTIEGVVFETARKGQKNGSGHHGILFSGDDNLFTAFDYRMRFIHDITVERCGGNVAKGGNALHRHRRRRGLAPLVLRRGRVARAPVRGAGHLLEHPRALAPALSASRLGSRFDEPGGARHRPAFLNRRRGQVVRGDPDRAHRPCRPARRATRPPPAPAGGPLTSTAPPVTISGSSHENSLPARPLGRGARRPALPADVGVD
jgi:hypothetical protein